jgi:hypothetical protein
MDGQAVRGSQRSFRNHHFIPKIVSLRFQIQQSFAAVITRITG